MYVVTGFRGGALAAALVASTALQSAQAADLPLKAKPVEYVKVCSLYGAGYYYMPGTDICLKLGGYVRYQAEFNSANGMVFGSTPFATAGQLTRTSTPQFSQLVRAVVTVDTRQQTAYGTLRTYIMLGFEQSTIAAETTSPPVYMPRGFIQVAGFTFGRAYSMFDIFTNTGRYSYAELRTDGDTRTYGTTLAAYTHQFGNGVSATISMENPGRSLNGSYGVGDGTSAVFAVNGVTNLDTGGTTVPDIIGNLRLDQAWGYIGLSGALHQLRAAYYNTPSLTPNGHPANVWGWAGAIGGMLNLPNGDSIGFNFAYSVGAAGYATKGGSWQLYNSNNSVGVGWLVDGLFDNTAPNAFSSIQRTTVWSINAGGEHRWTPQLATSVYGGYTSVSYNAIAQSIIAVHLPGAAGTIPCGVPVAGAVWPPLAIAVGSGNRCSANFSFWQVGSRTEWAVTPDRGLRVGVDVTYTHLNTAFKGTSPGLYPVTGAQPANNTLADQSIWSAIFRVQREFYP